MNHGPAGYNVEGGSREIKAFPRMCSHPIIEHDLTDCGQGGKGDTRRWPW